MLSKNKKLKSKIWLYLIIFSILILSFLWFFQVIFLDSYYEWSKTKEITEISNKVKNNYNSLDFIDILDELSFKNDICIEINKNNSLIYSSNTFKRGCTDEFKDPKNNFLQEFINSNEDKKIYKLLNSRFNNRILVVALKLDINTTAYITTSLEPLGSITKIFANQLIYVTIGVLILSFVIGYFISKKIASPITSINESANNMSKGNYDIKFEVNSDIEEINELADTLNKTKNELSKTEELRRELMANVSHDLKTPLTMIKAYAEMVRDLTYKNKEKRNDNLNVIIEETDRLNILVNDILDLSKIQSGTENLSIEKFNITELIRDIMKRYDILVQKENYQFILKFDKDYFIKADKKRIEQVIYNLINNAINYTGEDNKIIIDIIDKKDVIWVGISDTGKGISKRDLDLIWDKYYKTDKKHKRNAVGTGLGLSIVKNILVKHDFKYGVDSVINKGTTFWFEAKR